VQVGKVDFLSHHFDFRTQYPTLVLHVEYRYSHRAPSHKSRAEIQRDNVRLQEKQEVETREKKESIKRVAKLEDKMAVEDHGAESAHPRRSRGT
jgi:hypothetical protein